MLTAMRKSFVASIFVLACCVFTFGQNSNCPTISVTGPRAVLQTGETATFSVSVDSKFQDLNNLQYIWSVDRGKITEGQGTATITVDLGEPNSEPTATVEIIGLPAGCPNIDSETAPMGCSPPLPILFDESEISSQHIGPAKLDALISELENNPDETVYFIIYPHKKDSADELKNREEYVKTYLIAKKISPDRMIFVTAGNDDYESDDSVLRIWRVPAGAALPTP